MAVLAQACQQVLPLVPAEVPDSMLIENECYIPFEQTPEEGPQR
jgi:hypothetical protein